MPGLSPSTEVGPRVPPAQGSCRLGGESRLGRVPPRLGRLRDDSLTGATTSAGSPDPGEWRVVGHGSDEGLVIGLSSASARAADSRADDHGIASSVDSGVWPYRSRYTFDGRFLRR